MPQQAAAILILSQSRLNMRVFFQYTFAILGITFYGGQV